MSPRARLEQILRFVAALDEDGYWDTIDLCTAQSVYVQALASQ